MLENIENKSGTVSEIYKGEELVWDKPNCDWVQPAITSNQISIDFRVFPKNGTKVELQLTELNYDTFTTKVIYSDIQESDMMGYVHFSKPQAVKAGDIVNFIISNPRCKTIGASVVVK